MNVWTYWEGPRPPFIDVCLASLASACKDDDFYLVTPKTLPEYLVPETLHPNYKKIKEVAIRAGCIRAGLLATHGGCWFDADTLGLQSPTLVANRYPGAEAIYTVWNRLPYRVLSGYIYLTASVAGIWLQQINDFLENTLKKVVWCVLGEGILTPLLSKMPTAVRVPRQLFLPVDIDSHVEMLLSNQPLEPLINSSTICFGLNHSYMMHHHPKVMAPPWDSDRLIHKLLRKFQGGVR